MYVKTARQFKASLLAELRNIMSIKEKLLKRLEYEVSTKENIANQSNYLLTVVTLVIGSLGLELWSTHNNMTPEQLNTHAIVLFLFALLWIIGWCGRMADGRLKIQKLNAQRSRDVTERELELKYDLEKFKYQCDMELKKERITQIEDKIKELEKNGRVQESNTIP